MYRKEFLTQQRNRDLHQVFVNVISELDVINLNDAIEKTVNSPAKRFYIGSDRAYGVLIRWHKYGITKLITPLRQEMFEEIYRRVLTLQVVYPDIPLMYLAEMAIEQPAPKFYLEISSAKTILCKYKSKRSQLLFL